MNDPKGKIDLTDRENAEKKLAALKEKTTNENLRKSIEEKQKYINKPLSKKF
ncbi:hypothetical protein G5B30_16440 [Sphingobacterium sp. SGG-5]|uniref:hypothetical protein n=1 Tax=Sphingobacterium sp. SGG-5 TaxID=2710881 RepID=UPI0013EC4C95|nr:hypothetical protein [Sphingobacterium sp. SGG-5]NGM63499.1 hypothetical protein [Sphingobacterium sp. SGG-5]